MSATRGLITDAKPRLYVRYDDGDLAPYASGEMQEFLRRALPLALCVNWDDIGTSGKLSVGHILDLLRIAQANRTTLSIVSHSRSNWDGYATMTYAQIKNELAKDMIEQALGIPVTVYMQPGDAGVYPWCVGHREILKRAMGELGYLWAHGLHSYSTTGGGDSSGFFSGTANAANFFLPSQFGDPGFGMVPGICRDPYALFGGTTDLANCVVTRESGAPSGASKWMFAEDGVPGSKVNDWDLTFQKRITHALALRQCPWVGLHGEARSHAIAVAFSTGSAVSAGHMSAAHMAWILKRLVEAGHIYVVSIEDWSQHIFSDFAPGIDLIDNPLCRVPMQDIGDRSAGDLLYARGMTTMQGGLALFAVTHGQLETGPTDANANARFDDTAGQMIDNVVGAAVVGPWGEAGGFRMKPGGASVFGNLHFDFGGLPPGNYRFSAALKALATEASNLSRVAVVAHRKLYPAEPNFDTAAALSTTVDEVSVVRCEPVSRNALNFVANTPTKLEVNFECPANPMPTLQASATVNPGSIANGATYTQDVTVAGAMRDARVRVVPSADMETGIENSAAVLANGTVRISVTNTTGAPVTPASKTYYVYVDKYTSLQDSIQAAAGSPQPWTYSIHMLFIKNGGEGVVGAPMLRYLGR